MHRRRRQSEALLLFAADGGESTTPRHLGRRCCDCCWRWAVGNRGHRAILGGAAAIVDLPPPVVCGGRRRIEDAASPKHLARHHQFCSRPENTCTCIHIQRFCIMLRIHVIIGDKHHLLVYCQAHAADAAAILDLPTSLSTAAGGGKSTTLLAADAGPATTPRTEHVADIQKPFPENEANRQVHLHTCMY